MNGDALGILIVAARREDRRALFNALDGQGYGPILSARDIAHARGLLAESPRPCLAVLDFCATPAESAAFGAELDGVPVIGLLGTTREQGGEAAAWNFRIRPPGVVEWLRTPIDPLEARARVESVLNAEPPHALRAGASRDPEDYRCIFEGSPDGLLFSDPRSGRILEVNAAFELASGFGAAQVAGRQLEDLFALDAAQRDFLRTRLHRGGEARLQCEQWRADGSRRPVEIVTRLLKRGGELVHFTSVHDARGLRDGRELLDALSQLALPVADEEALQSRLARLAAALRFDYAGIAACVGSERQLRIVAANGRLPASPEPWDPATEPAVRMAADGEPVVRLACGPTSASAPPGIAGLPCCIA
ncbi:MAG TPA: PAS domain S-box protein, partial [Rhodanobacteraceae bacterium]|nr:PAS domain S-box protein [Rhodanobacteraceae bacterium]